MSTKPLIYIDADACPVKDEIYRVAKRFGLSVWVVSNMWMRVPVDPHIHLEVVGDGFDEADDWIVEAVAAHDIVIATDIPLAARCLKKGARVLNPKGFEFREESISDVLADREIKAQLREAGVMTGGPAPFGPKDRSRFLQCLDTVIHAALRARTARDNAKNA